MEELIDVLTKLENTGYRLSKSKSELFQRKKSGLATKLTKTVSDRYKTNYWQ